MDYPNGEFQYLEFASRNLSIIQDFYTAAFGWEFESWGDDYISFKGTYVQGGFYVGEPVLGSILPIIYAADLDETFERVQVAGGEIVRDVFQFPGGRRFHFLDLDGNEIAVWSE